MCAKRLDSLTEELMTLLDAANDAHCAMIVYHKLLDMASEAKVTLDPSKYTKGVTKGASAGPVHSTDSLKTLSAPVMRSGPIRRMESAPSSSISFAPSRRSPELPSEASSSRVRLKPVAPVATVVSISDVSESSIESQDYFSMSSPPASRSPSPEPTTSVAYRSTKPTSTLSGNASLRKTASASTGLTRLDTADDEGFVPIYQRPQHIRAYNLWHVRCLALPELCATLRSKENPLKQTTVM